MGWDDGERDAIEDSAREIVELKAQLAEESLSLPERLERFIDDYPLSDTEDSILCLAKDIVSTRESTL